MAPEYVDVDADGVQRVLADGPFSAVAALAGGCWEIRLAADTSRASVWVDVAA